MNLDPIDYQILSLLQRDARVTQSEIAAAVGLSQPAVADRIRKLDESGAVTGYVARLDPRHMGNDIRAFVGVRIAHPRHHDAFTRGVQEIPEVLECHRVAGVESYLLKVVTRNTGTLDELISGTLRRLSGVTRTQTTIVLSTVKEGTAVPLPLAEALPARRPRRNTAAPAARGRHQGAGLAGDGRSPQGRSSHGGAGLAGDGRSPQGRSIKKELP